MKTFLLRHIRAISAFYSKILFISLLINVCCLSIYRTWGASSFPGLLWLKVLSNFLIVFFLETFLVKPFYYYHNLGFSKKLLWIFALSIDFLILVLMLLISSQF